ncbi:hypothetical protein EXIGLDRAFT_721396 [Exidia glandulosa HHB12029]|uniref:Heme haloperoxidase family profile domain-containing protein n=1 Tax=Exidia glandulosa HHB12029 TaxID=1314781 RepID=A0A165FSC9_EXIGL|nr:hypothetical protein EXIGLDRAFT_721396 [Exidia glandulosa HHB12029]
MPARHNTRRPTAELAAAAMSPETQPLLANEHIKHWEQPKGKLSPCPALNTLCNHNAYGMPRDGQAVHAAVLANAVTEVYGMNKWFSRLIVYGAVLGINRLHGLTIDMQRLCEAPIPHWAALVHGNPDAKGRVEGHPDKLLCNQLLELANGGDISLDAFAEWRNIREQSLLANDKHIPLGQRHVAAGELSLLLQVLGDEQWTVKNEDFTSFVVHERLPRKDWRPRRTIGYRSTVRLSSQILSTMAVQKSTIHVPLKIIFLLALCALAGVVFAFVL